MKLTTKILLTITMAIMATAAYAHKNLDSVINKIETGKDVQYVACSERRNPATKRVYKSSKAIVISNQKQIEQLIKAFKSDSKDAVLYEIGANGNVYNIRFQDKDEQRSYTLVLNSGYGNRGDALLTVEYYNSTNARRVSAGGSALISIPGSDFIPLPEGITIKGSCLFQTERNHTAPGLQVEALLNCLLTL